MRVISLKPLRAFWQHHADAEKPLRDWFKTATNAQWRNLKELQRTYPHADGVRTANGDVLTVFNIAGNKFRLVARIRYDFLLINVRHVLTHAEYDRGKWKQSP